MSYKLHSCKTVGKKLTDGVLEGFFDDCAISAEGSMITISKGKLLVSGYEVVVDGREVITIPSEWESGEYYLIGSLAVEDFLAKSFYFALRDSASIKKEEVFKTGFGKYEIFMAKVVKDGENTSILPLISVIREDGVERINRYNHGEIRHASIIIDDGEQGFLSGVELLGETKCTGNGHFYCVPSEFNVICKSKNLFDYKSAEVKSEKTGNYVYGENFMGDILKYNNGFDVLSQFNYEVSPFGGGELELYVGRLDAGTYTLSFDALWKANHYYVEQNNLAYRAKVGGVEQSEDVVMLSVGRKSRIDYTINVTTQSEVSIIFYFNGMDIRFSDIQVEKGETATSYVDYAEAKIPVKIRDTEGNLHELYSVVSGRDEVVCRDGKHYLIKRMAIDDKNVPEEKVKPLSFYYGNYFVDICPYIGGGQIMVNDGDKVLYEMKEPIEYELDESGLNGLSCIPVFGVEFELTTDCEVKPIISASYAKSPYTAIQSLKNLLK